MQPIKLTTETRNMAAPSNWDDSFGECASLSIQDVDIGGANMMYSLWELSDEDLQNILKTPVIQLGIMGTQHPVVQLSTLS